MDPHLELSFRQRRTAARRRIHTDTPTVGRRAQMQAIMEDLMSTHGSNELARSFFERLGARPVLALVG